MTDSLELLRGLFIERCRTDLERLRRLDADDPDLGRMAHQLAGSAGSFGYPEISEAAAVVDDRVRYGPTPGPQEIQALAQALEKAIGPPEHTSNPVTPS